MAASKAKKKPYRVTNWRAYNESLVRRGDTTFRFRSELLDAFVIPGMPLSLWI